MSAVQLGVEAPGDAGGLVLYDGSAHEVHQSRRIERQRAVDRGHELDPWRGRCAHMERLDERSPRVDDRDDVRRPAVPLDADRVPEVPRSASTRPGACQPGTSSIERIVRSAGRCRSAGRDGQGQRDPVDRSTMSLEALGHSRRRRAAVPSRFDGHPIVADRLAGAVGPKAAGEALGGREARERGRGPCRTSRWRRARPRPRRRPGARNRTPRIGRVREAVLAMTIRAGPRTWVDQRAAVASDAVFVESMIVRSPRRHRTGAAPPRSAIPRGGCRDPAAGRRDGP